MISNRLIVLSCSLSLAGFAHSAPSATQILVKSHPLTSPLEGLEPEVLDFRYAPKRWQTCIGLPDDPFKTLVGSDGGLYSDFSKGTPKLFGFGTRFLAELIAEGKTSPVRQELHSARVPVVITRIQRGNMELRQQAWADAPDGASEPKRNDFLWLTVSNTGTSPVPARLNLSAQTIVPLKLDASLTRLVEEEHPERVFCTFSRPCAAPAPSKSGAPERLRIVSPGHHIVRNWATPVLTWVGRDPTGKDYPVLPCIDVFKHVIVGNRGPIVFEFTAEPGRRYIAAFGFIEAWHKEPGKRPFEVRVEGKTVHQPQFDLTRQPGLNQPMVLQVRAQDEDGDGKIRFSVHPMPGAPDQSPVLSALWVFPAESEPTGPDLLSGKATAGAIAFVHADHLPGVISPQELAWDCGTLPPGQKFELLLTVPQSDAARCQSVAVRDAKAELARAIRFWEAAPLPYGVVQVPDPAMQSLLDGCVRNLYQARELKNGHPKFQVGPTCYRGAWAADGAFILETIAYLGRAQEAREGIEAQIDQDDGPGGVEFSKKSGLRLFTLWRHAQLTGDRAWLRAMWQRVEREVNQIQEYRSMSRKEPGTPNFGLMPPGLGDGGLSGPFREYTNVYWTLAGLRAAIDAARWLNEPTSAAAWQAELDDYWTTFDKARQRDKQTDKAGNTYVPPVMAGEPEQLPQRGAWAFLQSIYPGRVFSANDPLMRGTLSMLDANQSEGLIYGTGWIPDGIWNYAASFYAHAHLWLGDGRKAASTLYAFGNHASPLLCWREEQNVRGEKEKYVGDMPHNWASAELIRLVRHLLVLERGNELHLFEGMPSRWMQPGAETRLSNVPTSFGPISLNVKVSADGRSAVLELSPPRREPPARIVVHTEHLGCTDSKAVELPASGTLTLRLGLK